MAPQIEQKCQAGSNPVLPVARVVEQRGLICDYSIQVGVRGEIEEKPEEKVQRTAEQTQEALEEIQ